MNEKKTEVGLVKRLVCGLLCAMVCATATACTTQQARPDLGQGTESEQIRDTEAPTAPPTGGQEPEMPPTSGENEQTPSGGDQTPSGGEQTPGQSPDDTPSQPTTAPTASELLASCNSKMATVATFGVQSKLKYDREGIGTASPATDIYELQAVIRAEALGTENKSIQYVISQEAGNMTLTMTEGAYYRDMDYPDMEDQDRKVKVTMTAEQYDTLFAGFAPSGDFLIYGVEDFGGSEVSAIEGGYRVKFKDPTTETLQEMLAMFDESYATKTWEDITEFAYTVDIAADGTLLREYLYIKFNEVLDPALYGAGALGIMRLTYEDTYSGYGTEETLTKPADESDYTVRTYEDMFGSVE